MQTWRQFYPLRMNLREQAENISRKPIMFVIYLVKEDILNIYRSEADLTLMHF